LADGAPVAPSEEFFVPDREIILTSLQHFYDAMKDDMSVDDRIEFYCNRKTDEGDTSLRVETFDSDKLSRVVMEEYSIRSKMRGSVIMALPRYDHDVPIFFFQIGGIGDRSIAVLDISPTHPRLDYAAVIPLYEKYHAALGLGDSNVGWLQKICSPYLLHCQYEEIDCKLFVEAMKDYLQLWLEHYCRRGTKLTDEHEIDVVSHALYKFKYILHHYDPAYGIFAKAWGKGAADAFVHLECSDYPAYLPPETLEGRIRAWDNAELNVFWAEQAQLLVMRAGGVEQAGVRAAIEQQAAASGFGIVTPELVRRFAPDLDLGH
jgi:hypothetical protein